MNHSNKTLPDFCLSALVLASVDGDDIADAIGLTPATGDGGQEECLALSDLEYCDVQGDDRVAAVFASPMSNADTVVGYRARAEAATDLCSML